MPNTAFQGLKEACHDQIVWLQSHAASFEQGKSKQIEICDGVTSDVSAVIAEQFRHQANNLQTVLNAYERLRARDI